VGVRLGLNQLVDLFNSGKKEVFPKIYDAFKNRLWSYLCSRANNREDAEEIFNTVSLNVYESLDKLEDPKKLLAWVIGIAEHRVGNYYSRRSPPKVSLQDFASDIQDPNRTPEERLIKHQRLEQLRKCIAALPDPQRTYVSLQFLAGTPQKEIAEKYNVNLNVLKSHILRSKVKILECMRRNGAF